MRFRRALAAALAILTVFIAGEILGQSSARSEAQSTPPVAPERSTAQIARERVKIAEEGLTFVGQMQQAGIGSNTDAADWIMRRAHAAVDLPDKAERLAVLQECSKRIADQVRKLTEMRKMGRTHSNDVNLAKFDALEIELLLAKARESN